MLRGGATEWSRRWVYDREVVGSSLVGAPFYRPTVTKAVHQVAVALWCNPADSWCQKLIVVRV